MRIAVVGTGYVGLVTGACLAEDGHDVACIDLDPERVAMVRSGRAPFQEEGLEELLGRHTGRRLTATTDLDASVRAAEVVFIAVGTPLVGGQLDTGALERAAAAIGSVLADGVYRVVVVKSTVMPGTTDLLVQGALERASGLRAGPDFGLAVNPEFLTEGRAVTDFVEPDRIVVGGIDERSIDAIERVYGAYASAPFMRTNPRTAEMIKVASNALLATTISFSNEIANVCSAVGDADVAEVMHGVHLMREFRAPEQAARAPITAFLEAGCGFGGSCLPKDTEALAAHGERLGTPMPLLRAVLDVNERRADELVARVTRHVPDLSGRRVLVLGLAFKPDTDDVRDTPAVPIVERLLARGARVSIHDPAALDAVPDLFHGDVLACSDLAQAVRGADAVVLVTRWPAYRSLPELLTELERPPVLIDGRRLIDKESVPRYDG
ncbi:MAG: UDP-glucose dehydrogenase family protein, partial [Gaiellales bacterium]